MKMGGQQLLINNIQKIKNYHIFIDCILRNTGSTDFTISVI